MSKKIAAARPALGLALAVSVAGIMASTAYAQTVETPACTEARATLATAILAVTEFSPNVYPGDVVPAVGQITPAFLQLVLADPDLGAGARDEVEVAVGAFASVETACAPVVTPTPTPTPAPTAPPVPTPVPVPVPDDGDDSVPFVKRGVNTGFGPIE